MQTVSQTINYHTANLVITPALGQISCAEKTARLTPVNMRVLVALLDRPAQVVSRQQLFETVWANQIVSDDTLTRAISDIRSMLKPFSLESALIETIPKKGYRWLAEIKMVDTGLLTESHVAVAAEDPKESLSLAKLDDQKSAIHAAGYFSKPWFNWLVWLTAAAVIFFSLTVTTIWLVKHQMTDRYTKVAMLPIDTDSLAMSRLAGQLREKLQQRILSTENIRFLSSRAGYHLQDSMVPYLSDEFSAKWIIEAEISSNQGTPRVSLRIVDAQTAVVVDSLTMPISAEQNLDSLIDEFIKQLLALE